MSDIVYSGRRVPEPGRPVDTACEVEVLADGRPLDPRRSLDVRNHSPTGFNWGYGGSGPAQLALALLLDVTNDPEIAQAHYQRFKADIVVGWGPSWQIRREDILSWLDHEIDRKLKSETK